MFYATRTAQITANITESQALSFYSKAERASFLVANSSARSITSAENAKLQTVGAGHTVSDKKLDITYFARIVK